MINKQFSLAVIFVMVLFASCNNQENSENQNIENQINLLDDKVYTMEEKVNQYIDVKLTADLSDLSPKEKNMIKILIDAANIIDEIFWLQAYGDKNQIFNDIKGEDTLAFVKINYGPWDRLNGHKAFVDRYGKKPIGSNFYPSDIKYLQFVDMKFEDKFSAYTLIKRLEDGSLYTIPYHKAFSEKLANVSNLLKMAAKYAENENFKKYLNLRADALLNDDFYESDIAWMDMKDNKIDFLVGPIEDSEDRFLNTKTAYESYLLIKDEAETNKLEQLSALLPQLQQALPVDAEYKKEVPGKSSDIAVYNAIYYSGFCNAGAKNISINRPLDGKVQLEKGNRKLIFKNVSQLKFEQILKPIANIFIDDSQIKNVKFSAFFENNLLFEMGEAVGIKKTVNNNGSVKEALKDEYNTINVAKAEVLRLFFATQLHESGQIKDGELLDNYVTQMANILRSVRFGVGHAQGKANMMIFNYFQQAGAFNRNEKTGKYFVDFEKMKATVTELVGKIITIQGNGDYKACVALVKENGEINEQLQKDILKIEEKGIKKDIVFDQGTSILGL
jgi:hypothetical protein